MAFNIEAFKNQGLQFGGARSSLFAATIVNPFAEVANAKIPFQCTSAEIPASTLANLVVPYFGREVKVAGNRTYADWTPTIINDEDFVVRNAMETWIHRINSPVSNLRDVSATLQSGYKTTATVTQFSKVGAPLREYKFIGIFPTDVSSIAVDWSTDAIENFTVTFAYDYWTVSGLTGTGGT